MARRLRPLRAADDPPDVASGRHVPHRRRPGRWRRRRPALRPSRQLARQRQPRQGAPVAVAGQAEVRPEDLLGRSPGPRRQRCHGIDGVQDVRLRLRATRHLGARRDLLGPRGHVARGRALQRPRGVRQSVRRRADGPDLREPGGARWQPGSAGGGQRHSRDLPSHGDERRRDGGAHRRRPHGRQGPWCRRRGVHRSRARGCPSRGARARLEEHLRQRQGPGRVHQRAGGRVDQRTDEVGQRVPRQPVQVRLRAHREPCRCEAMDPEESRGSGHRARCS